MAAKRIFAGLGVTLLLFAVSLGAACQLSCSFSHDWGDCHLLQSRDAGSKHPEAEMEGMDMSMSGMSMPDLGNRDDQTTVSAAPTRRAGHPFIGEMGACERQSCDSWSAAFVRTAHSFTPQFHLTPAVTAIEGGSRTPLLFHDARDDISPHLPRAAGPPPLSLRI